MVYFKTGLKMDILHLLWTSFLLFVCFTGSTTSAVTITTPPTGQLITYGQNDTIGSKTVELKCSFTSSYTVNATWTRQDGTPLKPGHTVVTLGSDTVLTIPSVGILDNDKYNCILEDVNGTVTGYVNLSVQAFPHVTMNGVNQTVRVNQQAIIICTVTGFPIPVVTWTRNGAATSGTKANNNSLIIDNVAKSDAGIYSCIANNIIGQTSSSIALIVHYPPEIVANKPNNTQIQLTVGSTFFFSCNATASPRASITIGKTGDLSPASGLSSLNITIDNVQRSDESSYYCWASNGIWSSYTAIDLIILYLPVITMVPAENMKYYVKEGEPFKITCDSDGNPQSFNTINKNTNTALVFGPGQQNHTIGRTTKNDGGNYSCVASNSVGSTANTIVLVIVSVPDAPRNLEAVSKTSASVELKWEEPNFDGNNKTEGYTVTYSSVGQGDGKLINFNCLDDCAVMQRNVTGLKPFTNYSFAVIARNGIGNSNSNKINVTTEEAAPSQPGGIGTMLLNNNSILVNLLPPREPNGIIAYLVYVNMSFPIAQPEVLIYNGSKPSFTFTSTAPYHQYQFRTAAYNIHLGLVGEFTQSHIVATAQAAPSSPPTNISLSLANSTEIKITWQPPPLLDRNGPISNYVINYTVNGTLASVITNDTSYDLTSVIPGQLYGFTIAAQNGALRGPFSRLHSIYSSEGVPGEPRMVSIVNTTSNPAFFVSWQPPIVTNGNITGYVVILMQKTNGSLPLGTSIKTNYSTVNTSISIQNLSYFSLYEVSVSGLTSAGQGAPSTILNARTIEGVPTAIQNLQAIPGRTFVALTWNPPENLFSSSVTYEIKQRLDNIESSVTCNNSQATTCNVSQLDPFSNYEFQVTARSSEGTGPMELIQIRTLVAPPPTPPTLTVPTDVSTTTFSLQLQRVPDTNGKISYYQVIVYRLSSSDLPSTETQSIPLSTLRDYDSNQLQTPPRDYYVAAEISSSEFDTYSTFVVGNGARKNRSRVVRRSTQEFYNAPLQHGSHYTAFQIAYVSDTVYSTSGWFPVVQTATPIPPDDGLGAGTIVAIIIAVIILILILAIIFYCLWKRKTNRNNSFSDHEDGTLDGKHRKPTVKRDPRVPIAADRFEEHVNQLKANGHFGFSQEYLMISRELINPFNIALKPENNQKNRYANVPAYDHSRVILANGSDGDYINANYIEGFDNDQEYIATQGPLPEYIHDFWTMVWEQNVATIVMLTRLEEKNRVKCAQYWSDNGAAIYKDITVTPMERNDFPDITMRTFHVTKTGQSSERNVKQYHFTAWPDFGVPKDTSAILSLIKRVNAWNPSDAGPIVVHCSAGVGRTGTYIAIDTNIKRINKQEDITVFMNVCSVRDQRCLMVQTEDQYIFIHNALLEYIESGQTEVAAESLREYIKQQSQTDPRTAVTGLMQEFLRLAKTNPENKYVEANKPCNQAKNRYKNVYPYDETRVKLVLKPGIDGSDFINANYIDGYAGKNAFIATQAPLENTVADFWRMMWEQYSLTVVMLSKENEAGKLKVIPYWPENEALKIDQFLIELVSTNKHGDYLIRDLKVTNAMEGSSRVVRQYQYIAWPENGSPDSGSGMIDLIGQVQKWNSSVGNRIVTVHCSAGVGKTGVFIALTNLIERLKMESLIDVYHAVKKMRQQRTAMVQTRDQYEFCYSALQEYLDSFDVIGNYK